MMGLMRNGSHPGSDASPGRRPQIVIVGAGFAGLAAAKRLRRAPVDVTLIDRRNHHLFQPLLYQVATAALSPADIAAPIRAILHAGRHPNLRVLMDEVISIDPASQCVLTRDNAQTRYDILVLATGSEFSYFGHETDWAPFAPGLKSIEDAIEIRRRVLSAFERAETHLDPAERERLLTFVLIGGGPTGVEMAGAIAELASATLARDFSRIDPASARILLVEAGPRLLAGFPEELSAYALPALTRMGVEVALGAPVGAIHERGIRMRGEEIAAGTVIWCAGVRASPVGRWLGVETTRNGAVAVNPDLSVPGRPEVFVLGDAASLAGPEGRPLPGLASVAKQQGQYVGDLIAARVLGRGAPGPFVYRDWGTMATIGRSAAVADFRTYRVTGFVAWLMWGLVHIAYLIGFRNRLVVTVNWMWAWLTYEKGARLITEAPKTPPGIARPADLRPPSARDIESARQANQSARDCIRVPASQGEA